jgi:hypothetical protein
VRFLQGVVKALIALSSRGAAPFEDLAGLGFLQVIVSKTKGQLDTVRELGSATKTG